MHIISTTRLRAFGREHADADPQLRAWVRVIRRKRHSQHLEVKADFPTADFIGPWKVVFNICRNRYRLIVDMRYDLGRAYVRHIVTHAEYDRLRKQRLL